MKCKKFFRNFKEFTGKDLSQSLFFNKVAGLWPETLLKKRLWHRCFSVNFEKFLITPLLKEHLLISLCLHVHFKGPLREKCPNRYKVFSGPYFPVFGLNTKIYSVNPRIQSEHRKIRTRKYSVFGHFSRSRKLQKTWFFAHASVIERLSAGA